jgi:DNA polymerase I
MFYLNHGGEGSSKLTDLLEKGIKNGLGFDLETTGLDPFLKKPIIISIGNKEEQAVINISLVNDEVLQPVFKFLEDSKTTIFGQNIKFDYKFMKRHYNVEITNMHDTMIADQIQLKGKKMQSSLDKLAERYLFGVKIDKDLQTSFIDWPGGDIDIDQQYYSAIDVMYLESIYRREKELILKKDLGRVLDLEESIIDVVGDMELNGLYINREDWLKARDSALPLLKKSIQDLHVKFKPYYDQFREGKEIKISSPKQLLPVLNWAVQKTLKRKFKNTNEKTLGPYVEKDETIALLMEYRGFEKLINAYGESFLDLINPMTNRIHPSFHQVSNTESGRFSCDEPNVEQIPQSQDYRTPFCAQDPDWCIVGGDMSQAEPRLLAHFSQEPELLDIYNNDKDIYARTAELIFEKEVRRKGALGPDDPGVNIHLRKLTKTLFLGLSYGLGPTNFAKKTGIDINDAKYIISKFWEKLPKVREFFYKMEQELIEKQYAISPLDGRKRWVDAEDRVDWLNEQTLWHVKNIAKNMPLQGGNATILKRGLRLLKDSIKDRRIKIINVIHDEILLESHKEEAEFARQSLDNSLKSAWAEFVADVPLKVDSYIAPHWLKG